MARSAKKQAAVADADGMSSASSAGGRPGNAGETIYRMSKKIAQLTKVVYYLNTRQEDHAVETSDLARVYEEEICDVRSVRASADGSRPVNPSSTQNPDWL
ncbi:MAG: hypothetical protein BJ554DRAFT_4589 [Olpidium bornovanus]|uniref:Uncharacterized protein n=1 Tax=Olpidium bornovanus TaxID=278681 RepID=A0A8H8DLD2_9FUNG|nr:MAG: hypothetical protein BJ554DRAFT_4589 [Olpidium bornovanus]